MTGPVNIIVGSSLFYKIIHHSVLFFPGVTKFKARAVTREETIQEVKAVGDREICGCIAW